MNRDITAKGARPFRVSSFLPISSLYASSRKKRISRKKKKTRKKPKRRRAKRLRSSSTSSISSWSSLTRLSEAVAEDADGAAAVAEDLGEAAGATAMAAAVAVLAGDFAAGGVEMESAAKFVEWAVGAAEVAAGKPSFKSIMRRNSPRLEGQIE